MESIIHNLSPPDSFAKAVQQFTNVLQRVENKSEALSRLGEDFESLLKFSLVNNDQHYVSTDNQEYGPNWSAVKMTINLVKKILKSLTEFNQ